MMEREFTYRKLQECKLRIDALTLCFIEGRISKDKFEEGLMDEKRKYTYLKNKLEEE